MPRGQNIYFRIFTRVRQIPKGKVATYGQIARLLNAPRSARIVGWALRSQYKGKLPWWRVINGQGMISIENMDAPKEEQVRRLRLEGVKVELREGNYWVDLKKYLWSPTITRP